MQASSRTATYKSQSCRDAAWVHNTTGEKLTKPEKGQARTAESREKRRLAEAERRKRESDARNAQDPSAPLPSSAARWKRRQDSTEQMQWARDYAATYYKEKWRKLSEDAVVPVPQPQLHVASLPPPPPVL